MISNFTKSVLFLSSFVCILINQAPTCFAEELDDNYDDFNSQDKRAGGRGFAGGPEVDNFDKRAGGRGFAAPIFDDVSKRAGGRGFLSDAAQDKRAGGRGFLQSVVENKRAGGRGFSAADDYHSAERRAGGRAFSMPATGDELWAQVKRAGGRPFYGMSDWKRAGGKLFHFYDSPMKRAGGRGFVPFDKRAGGHRFIPMDKRAGGRGFLPLSYLNGADYYAKRAGSRPFYAATSWRGYPLQ